MRHVYVLEFWSYRDNRWIPCEVFEKKKDAIALMKHETTNLGEKERIRKYVPEGGK